MTLSFVLLIAAAAAAMVVLFRLRPGRRAASAGDRSASPGTMYSQLRNQALRSSRDAFGLPAATLELPSWGVFMETGYPEGTATLVSLTDGSASLYFSGGGGMIGGGAHDLVRKAALAFLREAGHEQPAMQEAKAFPLPAEGWTLFYVMTDAGVFTAEAQEADLGGGGHPLSTLFYAGQEVITQLRAARGM